MSAAGGERAELHPWRIGSPKRWGARGFGWEIISFKAHLGADRARGTGGRGVAHPRVSPEHYQGVGGASRTARNAPTPAKQLKKKKKKMGGGTFYCYCGCSRRPRPPTRRRSAVPGFPCSPPSPPAAPPAAPPPAAAARRPRPRAAPPAHGAPPPAHWQTLAGAALGPSRGGAAPLPSRLRSGGREIAREGGAAREQRQRRKSGSGARSGRAAAAGLRDRDAALPLLTCGAAAGPQRARSGSCEGGYAFRGNQRKYPLTVVFGCSGGSCPSYHLEGLGVFLHHWNSELKFAPVSV